MGSYLFRVVIALSMLINVILGGSVGQTLSARSHARRREGKVNIAWLIDMFAGKNHCMECWAYWTVRKW